MKKYLAILLLSATFISGCSSPLKQSETELETETEVPMPDVLGDETYSLTYQEITIGYTVTGTQAFGVESTTEQFTVYPDFTKFDSCEIHVAYMPNFNWYKDIKEGIYYRDLGNGYTAYAISNNMSEEACAEILNNIQVINYTPVQ